VASDFVKCACTYWLQHLPVSRRVSQIFWNFPTRWHLALLHLRIVGKAPLFVHRLCVRALPFGVYGLAFGWVCSVFVNQRRKLLITPTLSQGQDSSYSSSSSHSYVEQPIDTFSPLSFRQLLVAFFFSSGARFVWLRFCTRKANETRKRGATYKVHHVHLYTQTPTIQSVIYIYTHIYTYISVLVSLLLRIYRPARLCVVLFALLLARSIFSGWLSDIAWLILLPRAG